MERILIIDDDEELCELVGQFLEPEGFSAEAATDGAAGLERAKSGEHVLIVLDVMLPRMNGLEVLRRLRRVSAIPVILLTARGDDVDRIVGLELGADDYLPKPFNPRELVARIHAVLRRSRPEARAAGAPGAPDRIQVGEIELDAGTRVVRRAGRAVELTTVEFNLLEALLRSAGRVVTRDQLAKEVLGRSFTPYDRSLDMHVSNLRRKLGDPARGKELIKTIRSVGYLYRFPREAQKKTG
jgi:DNA-binding response OmpR family regulator